MNRHHLVPKLKGGTESFWIHRVCHAKIHSLWTEAELAREFNRFELIRDDERMRDFVAWVRRKPADWVGRTRSPRGQRGRRTRR